MTEFKLVDGVNHCSNEQYHGNKDYYSSSGLKVAYKSIEAFKDQIIDGNRPAMGNENSLSEGSLTHSEILEPHNTPNDFVFYEGLRKAGAEFEKFKASLDPADAKKIIISKPQRLRVQSYLKAYNERPEAVAMIKGGHAEHTICGELFGVKVKVRFDYVNIEKGEIYDVKTTAGPADIEAFKETIKQYSYQLSAALYLEMAEQFYGKKFTFYFIVISKMDPQVCEVFKLSEQSRSEGLEMVRVACEKIKRALETGDWSESKTVSGPVETSSYEILEI